MNPAIQLSNITKAFGDIIAIDKVSLSIEYGEILAILGENGSGKTTLMNIVSGIYYPDSGQILCNGQEVIMRSPRSAYKLGIGMIHQHYKLIEAMTAAENIMLGVPGKIKLDKEAIATELEHISERYGFEINLRKKVYDMSISEKQTVEIIKALYRGASILILDEPTAVLTPQETEKLFMILRKMRDDGNAIVIITHKLHEVMSVSDKVAILRKGEYIGTVNTAESHYLQLTEMMVGRAVNLNIHRSDPLHEKERLALKGVSCFNEEDMPTLDDVSFSVFGGEIVGIAGITGSGQRELCEAISGLCTVKSGTIEYIPPESDERVNLVGKTPIQIRLLGIAMAYVPEDRLGMGLVAGMDMVNNMMLRGYRNGKSIFADRKQPKHQAEEIIAQLEIATPGVYTAVRKLSGGNVQKVLVGREISLNPTVLVAAYPVRGLDINSAYTIYRLLNEQKEQGVAVIFIGEDLDVLLELCDRIVVLASGVVTGIVDARSSTKEELGLLMTNSSAQSTSRYH